MARLLYKTRTKPEKVGGKDKLLTLIDQHHGEQMVQEVLEYITNAQ